MLFFAVGRLILVWCQGGRWKLAPPQACMGNPRHFLGAGWSTILFLPIYFIPFVSLCLSCFLFTKYRSNYLGFFCAIKICLHLVWGSHWLALRAGVKIYFVFCAVRNVLGNTVAIEIDLISVMGSKLTSFSREGSQWNWFECGYRNRLFFAACRNWFCCGR